jgi:hypothetical protein
MSATRPVTSFAAPATAPGLAAAPAPAPAPAPIRGRTIDPKQKEFTALCIPQVKKILIATRSLLKAMIEAEGAMAKRPLNCNDPKIQAKLNALKAEAAKLSRSEYEARLASITSETIEGRVQFLEAGYKILAKKIAAGLPQLTESTYPVDKRFIVEFMSGELPKCIFIDTFHSAFINPFLTLTSNFGTPAMTRAWSAISASSKEGKLTLTSHDYVKLIEEGYQIPLEKLLEIAKEDVCRLITLLPDQPADLYVLAKQVFTRSLLTFVGGMPLREKSMKAPVNPLGETAESTLMTACAMKERTLGKVNLCLLPVDFVLPHADGNITPNEYRDLLRQHAPLGLQAFENYERYNGAAAETFLRDHARTIYSVEGPGGTKRYALAVPAPYRFIPMTIDGILSLGKFSLKAIDTMVSGGVVAAAGPLNLTVEETANFANAAIDTFMTDQFTTHKNSPAAVKAEVADEMALLDNFRKALLNVLIAGLKGKANDSEFDKPFKAIFFNGLLNMVGKVAIELFRSKEGFTKALLFDRLLPFVEKCFNEMTAEFNKLNPSLATSGLPTGKK